jgi:hypothetical protein
MHRRSLLGSTALLLGSGLAGCTRLDARPEVRIDSGHSVLHPAEEQRIAGGLQPGGDEHQFTAVVPDEAPGLIGPDAGRSTANALRRAGDDQFHVVAQLRSTPDEPLQLRPESGAAFEWRDRSTLHMDARVEPWGSFDRIDDEDLRERLRSADELVSTSVWNLTPAPDELPERLTMDRKRVRE